jgi:hypothetical protein
MIERSLWRQERSFHNHSFRELMSLGISIRADDALRTLACLIGRQMAREQFEPRQAIVHKRRYLAETSKIANSRTAP